MPGFGPIVETIHYSGEVFGTDPGFGYAGLDADLGHPYPGGWDATAAENARSGAYAAQAKVDTDLHYEYERDRYVDEFSAFKYQYVGGYGRTLRWLSASEVPTPDIDPELPPGTTFWQWDSESYQLNTAVLDVTFEARLAEWNADDGYKSHATSDESTLYIKRAAGVTYTFGPFTLTDWDGSEGTVLASTPVSRAAGDPAPTATVDLMPYVGTTLPGLIEFATGVTLGAPDTSPTIGDDFDGGFELVGGVNITVTYGIQMGYRFWYTGDPPVETLTVVRQYPATSSLAWGGSGRIYPPDKAQRTIGGQQ